MVHHPDMVVSGIPDRNGIRHAGQVACMSIDLVKASEVFVIPHLPETPMKIRVGLHSGEKACIAKSLCKTYSIIKRQFLSWCGRLKIL